MTVGSRCWADDQIIDSYIEQNCFLILEVKRLRVLHEQLVAVLRDADMGLSGLIALVEGEMARSSYEDTVDFGNAQTALTAIHAVLAKVDKPCPTNRRPRR